MYNSKNQENKDSLKEHKRHRKKISKKQKRNTFLDRLDKKTQHIISTTNLILLKRGLSHSSQMRRIDMPFRNFHINIIIFLLPHSWPVLDW